MKKGTLYWITGLSGAGKTTIGNALYYKLKETQSNLVILDGDILKGLLGGTPGYSTEDRKNRARCYSNICKTLTDQGITVVICTIAMYENVRQWNRQNIENYVEVFLRVDQDVLVERDRKGLYSEQAEGKLRNLAGVDQAVEFPEHPDIIIDNNGQRSVQECVQEIVDFQVHAKDSFNRDVLYWNQYYKQGLKEIQQPSDFAKFALSYMQNGGKLMDVGCGNGRDSLYFAANGLDVVGVDASEEAISRLKEKGAQNTLFVCDDFVTCRSLYQMQYDYFYSRWTIHAITEKQEEELLLNISNSIKKDGLLFIEVRSVNDYLYGKGTEVGKDSFQYNDHFRRFIRKEILQKKLENLGFDIEYSKEGNDFSKTVSSDPTLIRMIARKQ